MRITKFIEIYFFFRFSRGVFRATCYHPPQFKEAIRRFDLPPLSRAQFVPNRRIKTWNSKLYIGSTDKLYLHFMAYGRAEWTFEKSWILF